MARPYKSEIRHSQIRELLEKVKAKKYGQYLYSMRLEKIRAFNGGEVRFEFPVTALIGTNGGGKSTILGCAACAYKNIKPGMFFPKSSVGDNSMANWEASYDLINKEMPNKDVIKRTARFRSRKWVREEFFDRPWVYFGIRRTVPLGEKPEFRKFANGAFEFNGTLKSIEVSISAQVERILGKPVSSFKIAEMDNAIIYVGKRKEDEYSEFHFGAGESSVIRMVTQMETVKPNALVLIEEIENGLHPIATRRMVEYLIDVAHRRSIQIIFTTHSEYALDPLPAEAKWASIDGNIRQGNLSIEALRIFGGNIEEKVAVLVEDPFAKKWVEAIVRSRLSNHIDEIGVYEVAGDGNAVNAHKGHMKSPAVKFVSVCIVDGDSEQKDDEDERIFRLPGKMPESAVFNYVKDNLNKLSALLTVSCQLPVTDQQKVVKSVEDRFLTNRDAHLLYAQVGLDIGFVSEEIVKGAFVNLWINENPDEVDQIVDFIRKGLEDYQKKFGKIDASGGPVAALGP